MRSRRTGRRRHAPSGESRGDRPAKPEGTLHDEAALFERALGLRDPAERDRFLDQQCGHDEEKRTHLGRLIARHFEPGLLDERLGASASVVDLPGDPDERVGDVVGPYRLEERIGEGGMGVVFRARQSAPLERDVAVKVMRTELGSAAVLARFDVERTALARFDHPNITRILDAGITRAGRPYFVMPLVRGESIVDFCDRQRLNVSERLALLVEVCGALHHAHRRGVLHRDIKPSNVLVTRRDGVASPTIIDFGIAKAVDQPLSERAGLTRHGDLIGTPEYVSPEQFELPADALDARTDVYALGAIAYELLTGEPPVSRERMRGRGLLGVIAAVRSGKRERPSTRVLRRGDAVDVDARRTTARGLVRQIAGDLDRVVLRALAVDRDERYESAAHFADDLTRFLSNEPVLASPPTLGYRVRMAYRRNRITCTLATLAVFFLIAGATLSTYWAISASRAEADATVTAQRLRLQTDALQRERAELKAMRDRAVAAEKKARAVAEHERNAAAVSRGIVKALTERFGAPVGASLASADDIGAPLVAGEGVMVWCSEREATNVVPFDGNADDVAREILTSLAKKHEAMAGPFRIDMLESIAQSQRTSLGSTSPFLAATLVSLGRAALRRKQPGRARPALEEAVEILAGHPARERQLRRARSLLERCGEAPAPRDG